MWSITVLACVGSVLYKLYTQHYRNCVLLIVDSCSMQLVNCSLFLHSNVAAPAPRKSLKEISSEIQAVIRQVKMHHKGMHTV
jgi:hypothetical protein